MLAPFILRHRFLQQISHNLRVAPVCALIGPRQCGKPTMAGEFSKQYNGPIHHFDLEDDRDLAKLYDPILTLGSLTGLIIIDEVHHVPDLFRTLRVLVDEKKERQFLILGSASQQLLQQTSETLAGRITYIEMTPFSFTEVTDHKKLWVRGGFPRSYLASTEKISEDWRRSYIKTFLEKDIPNFGITIAPQTIRRFWTMVAHYHGNIFNASEIGQSLGINYKTAQHYLDLLEATFMLRRLNPWFGNVKKRQVKSPKIYFRDSGLFHTLLGIHDYSALVNHPKVGASWEGFAMEQVIRQQEAETEDCYFWATHTGAELDLLISKNGKNMGFEFKYTSHPTLTKSIHSALEDLKLHKISIITPDSDDFLLSEKVEVCSLKSYLDKCER
jgi:predicted AAA+ superfamily ATPase